MELATASKREFLENHSARLPIASKQQGTDEMTKTFSLVIAGAQDMDTIGYELSALDGIEFFRRNPI